MANKLKCPVCGKPLTQNEYDKALGLWKDKQEHIKHLESEQKKLKELEKQNRKKFQLELQKLKKQEKLSKEKLIKEKERLKKQEQKYRQEVQKQSREFKKRETQLRRETKKMIEEQAKKAEHQLKIQKKQIESNFKSKMKSEIKKGVEKGVAEQKKHFKKQQAELTKNKNKMKRLEKSLELSSKKYAQANEEIKKLREQLAKGITPQIEGLLEEHNLLKKLKELFPQDKFEHPGKGGDIIQIVMEQNEEIGKIVYECKKVKTYSKRHLEQARQARRQRGADFAILVTNAFPAKKQYYYVENEVFVISPINLEPISFTLRESLVKISILKMSNQAKEKAVQKVYDYLSSNDYRNRINDVANQLLDLGKDLKSEINTHRKTWQKRYRAYYNIFTDVGIIDFTLRDMVHKITDKKPKQLSAPQQKYVKIDELE